MLSAALAEQETLVHTTVQNLLAGETQPQGCSSEVSGAGSHPLSTNTPALHYYSSPLLSFLSSKLINQPHEGHANIVIV
jgi:hypothetical protein